MTKHRLYFSHSYDLEDLRFNEHLWKLLMEAEFHAWIDTGREVVVTPSNDKSGTRRLPMDIAFNEWMMSQCDGFVAIAPRKRRSEYQLLEYRVAVRMGVPRLVLLQQGGIFNAPGSEIIDLPTSWNLYWQEEKQSAIRKKIVDFAKVVQEQKSAGEVLRSIGRWRPRENVGMLRLALLQPRAEDSKWLDLQRLLQRENAIQWTLLSPANIQAEQDLLEKEFDLLVLDVGPRGTPQELIGYIHALGIPQIRLCRVDNENEERVLGRFLDPVKYEAYRFLYEQDPPDKPHLASIPRFLDGSKLDEKMQPVVFWNMPQEAADQILDTTRRISMFRSGLSPEEGGIAETIDTHQSAKKYFDQHYQRAQRAFVFLSFAGHGGASKLADHLSQILRFQNLRCFHYRDEDSHSNERLESGEDVATGLKVRVNEADIVVYLIEENFTESDYCKEELKQGLNLLKQGQIELRAYRLDTLSLEAQAMLPEEINSISVHEFRKPYWSHPVVEQKIIADIEKSVEEVGWVLRERDREILFNWLKQDERDSIDGVKKLLGSVGVPETELAAIAVAIAERGRLDTLLRLPRDRDKQKRARQIVALLLLAATHSKPDRRRIAADWLYNRHVLKWPPLVASDNEDSVEIGAPLIPSDLHDTTTDGMAQMVNIGQKLGQQYPQVLSSSRPLCVTAKTNFLTTPVEWACETQHDPPIAVRRPLRWRLTDVDTRPTVLETVTSNDIPPATVILALVGPNINPGEQARQLTSLLQSRYETLGWPPELVIHSVCHTAQELVFWLRGSQRQVFHIAGHMGGSGLQVGDDWVDPTTLTHELQESDVRLVVLNGCEGGKPISPVAVNYLTLAERLIRDSRVSEVVAHRNEISESDALAFAKAFHTEFFNSKDGFEPARAAFKARRAASESLRYSPVVISQRKVGSSSA